MEGRGWRMEDRGWRVEALGTLSTDRHHFWRNIAIGCGMRILLMATAALFVPVSAAGQAIEDDVLGVVQSLFDAMHEPDADAIRAVTDSLTRFTLTRQTPEGVRIIVMNAEEFIGAVAGPDSRTLFELIRNPVVQIDGPLATVWAEYQVHIDGQLSHCGYDAFDLVEMDDGWKIINLSDTARRSGCGEMWQ